MKLQVWGSEGFVGVNVGLSCVLILLDTSSSPQLLLEHLGEQEVVSEIWQWSVLGVALRFCLAMISVASVLCTVAT